MSFSTSPATRGNLVSRSPSMPSFAPLTSHCSRHEASEVPDPYYGGEQGFEHVLDLLEDACSGLLKRLR